MSITTAFATNWSGSPGLIYQPGSLAHDFNLTAACFGFPTVGTGPDDPVARVDFTCPPIRDGH